MKKLSLLSLLSFIVSSCSGQSKKAFNDLDTLDIFPKEQTALIYEKVKYLPNETHLSFAFINDGETQLIDVKRENDTLRVIESKGYVFEIGSISKVFTSTLLADAAIRGEVGLDDQIALPLNNDLKITYKQLSNHTSGLPRLPKNIFNLPSFNSDNPYKDYNEQLLESYLAKEVVLDQNPGEKSSYSNLGAGLLGHLLSKNAGKSYDELLKERIFSTYRMTASTTIKEEAGEALVLGRDAKGEITSNWDLASLQGAGGILSTAQNLAEFVNAHFYEDSEMLALSRKRTFTLNKNVDIGLGWHIINTKSGDSWHWHNGGTGGYSSSMAMDVVHKKAVIILTNLSAFHKLNKNIDPLCFELMNSLKKE